MEQPSLFPEYDKPKDDQPLEVDTEAIARGAREYDPNKPVSEAAADQGWGPIDLPEKEPVVRPARKFKVPRYTGRPIPGESEGEQLPAGHQPFEPLSPQEKAAGRIGLAAAREAINNPED